MIELNFYRPLTFTVISLQTIFPLLLGFSRGYFVPAKDSTEKAIWNHGGECEEGFEGIYFFLLIFLGWGVRREGVSFIIMLYEREAILNKHCFHPKFKRAVH